MMQADEPNAVMGGAMVTPLANVGMLLSAADVVPLLAAATLLVAAGDNVEKADAAIPFTVVDTDLTLAVVDAASAVTNAATSHTAADADSQPVVAEAVMPPVAAGAIVEKADPVSLLVVADADAAVTPVDTVISLAVDSGISPQAAALEGALEPGVSASAVSDIIIEDRGTLAPVLESGAPAVESLQDACVMQLSVPDATPELEAASTVFCGALGKPREVIESAAVAARLASGGEVPVLEDHTVAAGVLLAQEVECMQDRHSTMSMQEIEVMDDSFDFISLPRPILQELSKTFQIRANMKNTQMADALHVLALNRREILVKARELAEASTQVQDKDVHTVPGAESRQWFSKRVSGDEDSMIKAQRLAARRNLDPAEGRRAGPSSSMATTPTVVLLPVWGVGHLMSMLEAGKRLLAHSSRALSLTVLVMRPPTEQYASEVAGHIRREEASGLDVRFVHLPAVAPPTDFVGIEEFLSRFVQMHAPHVRAAISGLVTPVAALVMDFFCTTIIDVSRDLAVPAYVYFTSNAAMLALFLRLPALHDEVTVEFEEMEEGAVDVPGLPPVPPSSLPTPVMDKKNPNYTWFVYHGRRFAETDGIIVNTAAEVEQSVLAAIADGRCTRGVRAPPVVYPIGPVIPFSPPPEQPHECVRWLDAQPSASVVFLCFGSGGSFAAPQAHEIARGLERSGHRFLWVLRGPPAPGSRAPSDANFDELLPEGFLERTGDRGLVWPTRAPQKEILAHAAVGGFVTHCGWNSILESLWSGVPMAPWPLYAEQHLNAFLLVDYLGVAVAMKVDRKSKNFVEAAELERAVKTLMGDGEEGRKAAEKAAEMKAACRNAVEAGGSSHAALQRLSEELHKGAVVDVRRSEAEG